MARSERRMGRFLMLTGSGLSIIVFALALVVHNRLYSNDLRRANSLGEQVRARLDAEPDAPVRRLSGHASEGFEAALRQAPDVIVVGEIRDGETAEIALQAAETGHLVLGTLHTGNAARTLDRVLDVFPTDQREQIRIMVSESLRGIISQQLVPRRDGEGRVLALEILMNTPAVANTIREGKTFMLPGIMQTGKNIGMITMDDSLKELYNAGLIAQAEAMSRCEDKALMKKHFES